MARAAPKQDPGEEIAHLQAAARQAPFLLRLTRRRRVSPPVLVVKERIAAEDRDDYAELKQARAKTVERGTLHGEAVRAAQPVLRRLLEAVRDEQGVPRGLERFMTVQGLRRTDLNLPLDEEAGAKLALFFRLQTNLRDAERIELIGRRVALFSREEAVYWLANITASDPTLAAWAVRGLRLMLCGEAGDPEVPRILERLRARG
ncbi:MAG: hypothetical protein U5L11_10680 [Arhodomonas sp.]|nr:hypothetical protein [Arhodomonas sp.]